MSEGGGIQVLPAGAGYGIVIGIGGVFAAVMLGITYLQNRYTLYSTAQSEEFNTASRNVKPGLIAAGIVSSWTWSATLLTSSTFTCLYGLCGGLWYGAMGTLQILLFALIAIKIKAKAPGAHTFPETVLARHGKVAHLTYLWNRFATNMLVGACLVLGGSQVVSALTGMNVYAACFLVPLVVAAYVIVGGLRSTFIADYAHSVILFIAIFIFGFTMYSTSDLVGSPGKFYDLLEKASVANPIPRNHDGSYLTFKSVDGLIFAVDLLVAGFSTVWLDQAYWQRAIASRPETSVKAYLLGGIAWFGIPFSFSEIMGLGSVALTTSPSFPTYPKPLSVEQISAGLSSPATAITLMDKGGAVLMLVLLFMAVTSSTSAELIACSSLFTFDIYKTYIKPSATSRQLVTVSHIAIIGYSLVLASFCCILNAVNVTLTWLLTVLGIIVGGASIPVGLVLIWGEMSTVATIASPWIGLAFGFVAWFVTTHQRSGTITVLTSGDVTNAVAGNITSWGTGALCAAVLSFVFPAKFSSTNPEYVARSNKINGIASSPVDGNTGVASPRTPESEKTVQDDTVVSSSHDPAHEKRGSSSTTELSSAPIPETVAPTGNAMVDFLETKQIQPLDPVQVKKGERLAIVANAIFLAVAIILVPFTLFGTNYVFSKPFFSGWIVVSFIWVWISMLVCVVYPVVESWGALADIWKGVVRDVRKKGSAREDAGGVEEQG